VQSNNDLGFINVVVGNNGPTHAAPSTLTITGFAAPITTGEGSSCTSSGVIVTCETPA
jgi:hypothetical protein